MFAGTLEAALNRVLALDAQSPARLERLQGKTLLLDITTLGIRLYFGFDYGHVDVSLEESRPPDTIVRGSPAALFSMAAPAGMGDWGLPGSGVRIEGDAHLARDVEKVFSQLAPDWETPLANVLGDTLGFQLASGLRQGASALREAAQTASGLAAGYFRDESGLLVKQGEMRNFLAMTDRLREGADRLEARIRALEAQRRAGEQAP